jgi:hypothetical protein
MPAVPALLPIYPVNDQGISLELQSKGAVACSLEYKVEYNLSWKAFSSWKRALSLL